MNDPDQKKLKSILNDKIIHYDKDLSSRYIGKMPLVIIAVLE